MCLILLTHSTKLIWHAFYKFNVFRQVCTMVIMWWCNLQINENDLQAILVKKATGVECAKSHHLHRYRYLDWIFHILIYMENSKSGYQILNCSVWSHAFVTLPDCIFYVNPLRTSASHMRGPLWISTVFADVLTYVVDKLALPLKSNMLLESLWF